MCEFYQICYKKILDSHHLLGMVGDAGNTVDRDKKFLPPRGFQSLQKKTTDGQQVLTEAVKKQDAWFYSLPGSFPSSILASSRTFHGSRRKYWVLTEGLKVLPRLWLPLQGISYHFLACVFCSHHDELLGTFWGHQVGPPQGLTQISVWTISPNISLWLTSPFILLTTPLLVRSFQKSTSKV